MFGLHPLFYVAVPAIRGTVFLEFDLCVRVQIVSEVLKQSHLLLQLSFCWIIAHFVGSDGISFVSCLLFDIFECFSILVDDDFGGVVEVDSSGAVREQITQPIFS